MTPAPIDAMPSFWTEPWRFAAPVWRALYGAPQLAFDRHAERLVYSGWVNCFGLCQRWRAPSDPGWLDLLDTQPARLHRVATTLGYLALARAGAADVLLRAARSDRASADALKYREVNCMSASLLTPPSLSRPVRGVALAPHACGVDVLCAMARQAWPDAESRFAMLVAPGRARALDTANAPNAKTLCRHEPVLSIDRIDVGRCLTICRAAVRQFAAGCATRGER
ncbi:MAG TPA: hypothetical protein VL635_20785 [Trinickia sp.]|nr:hypothetical protein [Trinickia sp.]